MTIREYLEQEAPILKNKLNGFSTIQEAEDQKAITKEEASQISYMIAYGKQSNLFKLAF